MTTVSDASYFLPFSSKSDFHGHIPGKTKTVWMKTYPLDGDEPVAGVPIHYGHEPYGHMYTIEVDPRGVNVTQPLYYLGTYSQDNSPLVV